MLKKIKQIIPEIIKNNGLKENIMDITDEDIIYYEFFNSSIENQNSFLETLNPKERIMVLDRLRGIYSGNPTMSTKQTMPQSTTDGVDVIEYFLGHKKHEKAKILRKAGINKHGIKFINNMSVWLKKR